jgi:hypothetical protein
MKNKKMHENTYSINNNIVKKHKNIINTQENTNYKNIDIIDNNNYSNYKINEYGIVINNKTDKTIKTNLNDGYLTVSLFNGSKYIIQRVH